MPLAGSGDGSALPPTQMYPAEHKPETLPDTQYRPVGQTLHCAEDDRPVEAPYVASGHTVGATLPAGQKKRCGQTTGRDVLPTQ